MDDLSIAIQTRYTRILERIEASARRCGRRSEDVTLVVVSKAQPVQVVEAAVEAGIHTFGENYAEEAVEKINLLRNRGRLSWHMIGHLQSRKSSLVAGSFDCLHSLDSLHLANRLNNALLAIHKTLPVLLEMNVSGEESKFGWPAWEESRWEDLIPELDQLNKYPQLEICGLMTMPPLMTESEGVRPYFARLKRLQEFLALRLAGFSWSELSMGTSADFETAVEEGATYVRVGQAILGPRSSKLTNLG